MRLLDRFLLRELAIPLAYCLVGFLIFWISFDLLSKLGEFQQKHLRAIDIAELYWLRLPELLEVALPMGFMLGLLYALSNHSRHHEITAMRSASPNQHNQDRQLAEGHKAERQDSEAKRGRAPSMRQQ